jgi:asparagine synthetase B (glutamine-hydrolysing)
MQRWWFVAAQVFIAVACFLPVARACSFLVTTKGLEDLEFVNFYLKHRGPDYTNHVQAEHVHFVHNLLHMTGEFTIQPFVKGPIVALFNGEIYNYRELGLGTFTSDGQSLIPAYEKWGETFVQHLKGEYAIVLADFSKGIIIVSTDVFGTKPLWVASEGSSEFGISSYASALKRLKFPKRALRELDANTIEIHDVTTFKVLRKHPVHTFDLRQHKTTLVDWNKAFVVAMERRATNVIHGVFAGMSSGFDSGVIALALTQLKIEPHHLFTILGPENRKIIDGRYAMLKTAIKHPIDMKRETFQKSQKWILAHAEEYNYAWNLKRPKRGGGKWDQDQDFRTDPGAVGLSHICELAQPLGIKIYLSGSGVDEIYTDYEGKAGQSTFGGIFPDDLSTIFPWPSFFGEFMRNYLRKEEYVSGAHGMEGRYPFLDVDLVQEFLWLTKEMKNRRMKYPLAQWMDDAKFPYHATKTGFNAKAKMQLGKDTTVRRSTTNIMAQDKSNHAKAGTSFQKIAASVSSTVATATPTLRARSAIVAAKPAVAAPAAAATGAITAALSPPPLRMPFAAPLALAHEELPSIGAFELGLIFAGVFGLALWAAERRYSTWRPKISLALVAAMIAVLLMQTLYPLSFRKKVDYYGFGI